MLQNIYRILFMFYNMFVQYEWPSLHRQVINSRRYRGINRKFEETTQLVICVMLRYTFTQTKSTVGNTWSNSRTQVSPQGNFIEETTYNLIFTSSRSKMHKVHPPFQWDVPLAHFLRGIMQCCRRHPIIPFTFAQQVPVEISG